MAKILVVEDDPGFQELLPKILNKAGYEVTVVGSGEEFLDKVKGHAADLVVLDVNLPGINGFDVCAALRKDPITAKLPVLMLTVNQRPKDVSHGLRSGADDYLPKPFKPDELRARVFALLRRVR